MGLSDPYAYSLFMVAIKQVKILQRMNPMGISASLTNSLDIFSFIPVKKYER